MPPGTRGGGRCHPQAHASCAPVCLGFKRSRADWYQTSPVFKTRPLWLNHAVSGRCGRFRGPVGLVADLPRGSSRAITRLGLALPHSMNAAEARPSVDIRGVAIKRWATAVALATALLAVPVVLAATGNPKEMVLTLADVQSVPDKSPIGNLADGFVTKLASATVGKDKEHGRIQSYWVAFENESLLAGHQLPTASYQPPTARYGFRPLDGGRLGRPGSGARFLEGVAVLVRPVAYGIQGCRPSERREPGQALPITPNGVNGIGARQHRVRVRAGLARADRCRHDGSEQVVRRRV
jgi:hypothetical protein